MPLSKIVADSITDDTITTDQIADTSVHGRRNLIINGAMQVAQRGTSSTDATYGTVDRFQPTHVGPTVTQSQQTLTSGSPYDEGFRKFLRQKVTTAGSGGATDYVQINYSIEAQDLASCGWKYTDPNSFLTLSFWARSSVAGTYILQLRSQDGSEYLRTIQYTLAADTWTKVTLQIQGNSNLQIDNDTGRGVYVIWVQDYGTGYTGGEEVSTTDWYSRGGQTDAYVPDFGHTFNETLNAQFDLTGVQLEVGNKASPFEHRSFGEELTLCQRYFHNTAPTGSGSYLWAFPISGASQVYRRVSYVFPTTMRANPSLVNGVGGSAGGSLAANKPSVESGWEGGTVVNLDLSSASESAYCWFQSGGFDAEL